MITVNVVCVGTIKENYWVMAINEYLKRLQKFCKLNMIEVPETSTKSKTSIQQIVALESQNLLKQLRGYVVVLDIKGKQQSSEELADFFNKTALSFSEITFVIGGSFGLSNELKQKADMLLSFSKVTFPHQLMRVILLEQIYRAFTINNNITYHK